MDSDPPLSRASRRDFIIAFLDYTSRAGSAKASSAKAADIDAMARAVIRGDYGSGEELRCRLGEKYAAVQRRVNELLK